MEEEDGKVEPLASKANLLKPALARGECEP